jgi:CLIP-associating protein 1/2
MASSAAVARLRELATAPGAGLDGPGAAALAECCAELLRAGGGDAEAAREALEALCAAGGGDAMRRHADGLAPLVVARLGDGDAAVREAARRFLVLLMEVTTHRGFRFCWFAFIRSLGMDCTGAATPK